MLIWWLTFADGYLWIGNIIRNVLPGLAPDRPAGENMELSHTLKHLNMPLHCNCTLWMDNNSVCKQKFSSRLALEWLHLFPGSIEQESRCWHLFNRYDWQCQISTSSVANESVVPGSLPSTPVLTCSLTLAVSMITRILKWEQHSSSEERRLRTTAHFSVSSPLRHYCEWVWACFHESTEIFPARWLSFSTMGYC